MNVEKNPKDEFESIYFLSAHNSISQKDSKKRKRKLNK
jgi:hypothetical protein